MVLKAFLYFELIRLYKIGFNVDERKYKQPDTYIRYWLNVRYLERNQNESGPKSGSVTVPGQVVEMMEVIGQALHMKGRPRYEEEDHDCPYS